MRNTLLENSLEMMNEVLNRSAETALTVYYKYIPDEETGAGGRGWEKILLNSQYSLSNESLKVFKVLHSWRDQTARYLDESTGYIMPNSILFAVAKAMPVTVEQIKSIHQNVTQNNATKIIDLIKETRKLFKCDSTEQDILIDSKNEIITNEPEISTVNNIITNPIIRIKSSDIFGDLIESKPFKLSPKTKTILNSFNNIPDRQVNVDLEGIKPVSSQPSDSIIIEPKAVLKRHSSSFMEKFNFSQKRVLDKECPSPSRKKMNIDPGFKPFDYSLSHSTLKNAPPTPSVITNFKEPKSGRKKRISKGKSMTF